MKTDNQSSLESKWARQAQEMRDAAARLPPGQEREQLARKARQLETASEMNKRCSSQELKPPR